MTSSIWSRPSTATPPPSPAPRPPLEERHTAYQSRRRAEEHQSVVHLIPAPRHTASLADLHRQYLRAREAATRLGAMPRRLLPVYRNPGSNTLALAPNGTPLPLDRQPTPALTRTLLQHTLPVPAAWVTDHRREHRAPAAWQRHALLADLILLPQDGTDPGAAGSFGDYTLRLDPLLGLVAQHEN